MATEPDTLVAETPAAEQPLPVEERSTLTQRLELDKLFDKLAKPSSNPPAQTPAPASELPPAAIETPPVGLDTTPATETPPALNLEGRPEDAQVLPETPPDSATATDDDIKTAKEFLANPHNKRQGRPWEKFLKEAEEHKKTKERLAKIESDSQEAIRRSEATKDYDALRTRAETAEKEAARYRAVVELENDPAFQAKYGEQETRLNATVSRALQSIGVRDKAYKTQDGNGREVDAITLEYIANTGGIVKFAKSHPQNYKTILTMLDDSDPVEADALRRAVGGIVELQVAKDSELAQIKKTPQTYQEQRRLQEETQKQQNAQRQEHIAKVLATHREQEFGKYDAFKILNVPEGAKPEEKARIEATNAEAQKLRDGLKAIHDGVFFNKFSADEIAAGALRAVLYESEKRSNSALSKENAALKAENDRLKKAGLVKPAGTINPAPASARQSAMAPVVEQKGDDLAKSVLGRAEEIARQRAGRESGNLTA